MTYSPGDHVFVGTWHVYSLATRLAVFLHVDKICSQASLAKIDWQVHFIGSSFQTARHGLHGPIYYNVTLIWSVCTLSKSFLVAVAFIVVNICSGRRIVQQIAGGKWSDVPQLGIEQGSFSSVFPRSENLLTFVFFFFEFSPNLDVTNDVFFSLIW